MPKTQLIKSSFEELPNWEDEDYFKALGSFVNSCKTGKTKDIYKDLCNQAANAAEPREFLTSKFTPYRIKTFEDVQEGLLTGYYEPELKGSLEKKEPYIYPIYKTPKDMLIVDLSEQYPELKNYRLRGKIEGNKVVPYYAREDVNSKTLDADVICYTDSKIDLFFLEVQGSGRVTLENGETIFIGYDNQNGYKYNSIGKYLVNINEIALEDISLQSIKAWLEANPSRVDEVLNFNKSMVFFRQKTKAASGSLGVVLTPIRSVAVDRRYIPLGSMLYLSADTKDSTLNHIAIAQDTGGAIKGCLRADMFCGYGEEAKELAGKLKAPLKLWILLPKDKS
ncbi:MAG: transglycosylase [Sulfurimonas sp. RIFOXYD12_FULL_33_39]|nr:MAG: transglycosylase [Sulfurimonas sp. RIFOXYD12_FULL_33_39]OHE14826.1 MAG: transglycosylase [Sulfurimonas sp. RIFOXYD2_FULL_34_21]